jgi:excisionase family DNA binding protein
MFMFLCIRWRSASRRRLEMEPLALSINDTAKALSLGRTSIYAMIADGRLDAFKLGRRTLIRMESIRRLVSAGA